VWYDIDTSLMLFDSSSSSSSIYEEDVRDIDR
jgi:hypothetical protein